MLTNPMTGVNFSEFTFLALRAADSAAVIEPTFVAVASVQKMIPLADTKTKKPTMHTIASANVVLPTESLVSLLIIIKEEGWLLLQIKLVLSPYHMCKARILV